MKIIISPSKTQNTEKIDYASGFALSFPEHSGHLFNLLSAYSKDELGKLMKIKNTLLDKTYEVYQSKDKDLNKYHAIDLYQGVVFDQIKVNEFDISQIEYMNEHLVILSAMYGAVKPNTFVYPYRLDMTMRPHGISLYQYWQDAIDNYFTNEELIINLASNEFSRMVKLDKDKILNIEFKEYSNKGQLRTVSYNAKKARGMMVHQLILKQIDDVDIIKEIVVDGYAYNKDLSSKHCLVFVK